MRHFWNGSGEDWQQLKQTTSETSAFMATIQFISHSCRWWNGKEDCKLCILGYVWLIINLKWWLFVTIFSKMLKIHTESTKICIKHESQTHSSSKHTERVSLLHLSSYISALWNPIFFICRDKPRRFCFPFFQRELCVNAADIWSHEQNMNCAYVEKQPSRKLGHTQLQEWMAIISMRLPSSTLQCSDTHKGECHTSPCHSPLFQRSPFVWAASGPDLLAFNADDPPPNPLSVPHVFPTSLPS